jgi:cell division septation protein DedD
VLASVPVSSKSRLAVLQRFADMQQKYSGVLQNKTPDIREANLGERGKYHRLLVGPPGSRSQASALCGELKSAGHKDCWVTAY